MKQRGFLGAIFAILAVTIGARGSIINKVQQENAWVVSSNADSGPGTLRDSLNRAASGAVITFDPDVFPLNSPTAIALTSSPLPSMLQGNLTIDASQAGVILDGSALEQGNCFQIESDGNVIKGLQILNFPEHAIYIFEAGSNQIGGINAGFGQSCEGDCNLINSEGFGVIIEGKSSVGNVVSGNFIGTAPSGRAGLGSQTHGIGLIGGAQNNLIGGDTDGEGNLISGNLYAGISLNGHGTMHNTVRGNWIGLYLGENRQAFPSDMAISPDYINDCTLYVTTLSTGVHKSTDCGETWVEVNNGLSELRLRQVEIPPDASDGSTLYALSFEGHLFTSTDGAASWRLVSTTMQGFDFRSLVLSADFTADRTMYAAAEGWSAEAHGGEPGVFKSSDGGLTWKRIVEGMADTRVRKVVVSPDPVAKDVLFVMTYSGIERSLDGGKGWERIPLPDPNVEDIAVSTAFARDQTIFVTTTTDRIYFSTDGGANWTGAEALGSAPRDLAISPNFISDRTLCYFSDEGGSHIFCSYDAGNSWDKYVPQLVGHLDTGGTRNAFSPAYPTDATIFNISIAGMAKSTDRGASWNMIKGLRDLGNDIGVSIENGASENIIGPDNVISNNNTGVSIVGEETARNVVIGNLIGTDPTGTFAQANSAGGVEIHAGHDNVIGGSQARDRNILSGNMVAGIWLGFPDTRRNTVIGNYIGTDISGEKPLGNGGEGGVVVLYGAHENVIGRDIDGERNVISGNLRDGIYIGDQGTTNNYVSGNYIGTDASGGEPLGNLGHGVSLNNAAGMNMIGPGNTIAFNVDGVAVIGQATTGNQITQNAIFSNNEVGIQAWDGGNMEISPPAITFIGSRIIRGSAPPNTTVEVFSDEEDEGRTYEGSATADAEGNFTFALPAGRFTGPNVTATATDSEGNTSKLALLGSPPTPVLSRELPGIVAPTQVSTEPRVVGTNLGLALFSVLFFGFTSSVMNDILEEYRDSIMSGFMKRIPRRIADLMDRVDSSLRRMTAKGVIGLVVIWLTLLLVVSIIESFLDPEIGMLSPERFSVIATLFIAALMVSALELGSDLFAHRRWMAVVKVENRIQWIGIAIAIVCVVLSRALHFKPGYLYGIAGAVYLIPKLTDSISRGKRAAFVLSTVFVGGLIFWISTIFLPKFLAELEPLFLTIFLISLQWVFFELFPLTFTDGGDLMRWRRGAWWASFLIVFFCFYHFVLNPNAAAVQALQQNGVQTLLILITIFGLATVILWLLFPFRLSRKKVT